MTHKITINGEQMMLSFATYAQPRNTAITLTDSSHMPYCKVSTNLGALLPHDWVFIQDDYEAKGIPVTELVHAGIITPTEHTQRSGFNTYRVYRILVELCPQCRSTELGFVPMSKVLVKTRKCLKCDYEWSLHND